MKIKGNHHFSEKHAREARGAEILRGLPHSPCKECPQGMKELKLDCRFLRKNSQAEARSVLLYEIPHI
jgi:hypothetical protein